MCLGARTRPQVKSDAQSIASGRNLRLLRLVVAGCRIELEEVIGHGSVDLSRVIVELRSRTGARAAKSAIVGLEAGDDGNITVCAALRSKLHGILGKNPAV